MSTVSKKINAGEYKNEKPYSSRSKNLKAWTDYMDEDTRLANKFRHDIAEECGILGHPKEEKVWNMAWEHGHSSGFSEIAIFYSDFADLVKP